jgi:hypothetical protein
VTIIWRDDVPAVRRRRSREAPLSGIYYGRAFAKSVAEQEARYKNLNKFSWWEGITSDTMFWKVLFWGGLVMLACVLALL